MTKVRGEYFVSHTARYIIHANFQRLVFYWRNIVFGANSGKHTIQLLAVNSALFPKGIQIITKNTPAVAVVKHLPLLQLHVLGEAMAFFFFFLHILFSNLFFLYLRYNVASMLYRHLTWLENVV